MKYSELNQVIEQLIALLIKITVKSPINPSISAIYYTLLLLAIKAKAKSWWANITRAFHCF